MRVLGFQDPLQQSIAPNDPAIVPALEQQYPVDLHVYPAQHAGFDPPQACCTIEQEGGRAHE
jgi:hypothetical protein